MVAVLQPEARWFLQLWRSGHHSCVMLASTRRLNFAQFLRDMGLRPQGSELHRMHNDGPYAPWNCFWSNTKPHAETIPSILDQGDPTSQRFRAQLRLLDVPVVKEV